MYKDSSLQLDRSPNALRLKASSAIHSNAIVRENQCSEVTLFLKKPDNLVDFV